MQPGEQAVIWTAATCDFRGAGVYVGLAPEHEHLVVVRSLGVKQMRAFVGGRMRARGEARPWPINYYAVRDPSAVRVIPVNQPALPNGFRPVQLRFRFPVNGAGAVTVARGHGGDLAAAAPSGFIVTIGLPSDQEGEFFRSVIDERLETAWDVVFERIAAYGCRRAKGTGAA